MPEETDSSSSTASAEAGSAVTAVVEPADTRADQPQQTDDAASAPEADEGEVAAGQPETGGESAVDSVPDISDEELAELRANETAYKWEASEFVHHHKGGVWYIGLFAGLAVLIAILFLLHFWLEIGLFVMMGIAIVVYGGKAPRSLVYELSPKGITIDGKFYDFQQFRAFGVLADVDWHQIDLEPVKRFAPRLSILFDSANADEIVGHLSLHLVRSDREPDPIERLARYLRF